MEIKKLKHNEVSDFRSLVEIFKTVFENDLQIADNGQLGKLLANPDFLVFVIKTNNEVVGGVSIYILHQYYSIKPVAYIYDVGISPKFQRKGLGKLLIAEVCAFCKTNEFEEAYVEAETDDMDAVNFYKKTMFNKIILATHFTYSFNK